MTPQATSDATPTLLREPLKYSGALDQFRSFDYAPAIGTEYPDLQLTDILDDDAKLRDLAITVSRRGVVFLRKQQISTDQMKIVASKLGELTGKPSTSKLHRHAIAESQRELSVEMNGKFDDEVWLVASRIRRSHYAKKFQVLRDLASDEWHTDLAYENVPADYGLLQIITNPQEQAGGDTLFASGYEAYERLSPTFRQMLEGMEVVKIQARMARVVDDHKINLIRENRGSPENSGSEFQSTHPHCSTSPVIRTNPVTGWKTLAATGIAAREGHFKDVTHYESEVLKKYLHTLVVHNHDLQIRFKWGEGDIAIWDNDFDGKRQGFRVLSVGERPYLDPASKSRREGLLNELQGPASS
ncbi:unnamed protein product [Clonostachys chloroleuca]|uniref:TauD/TfdA-like domain-containing protein n=1 Tax=Clonostachys chloroleuca TaxID=1926264 RepID=A0AA35Q3W7_9HYPO|nr:unnamed protein product [Clonostachys chloroleuca]